MFRITVIALFAVALAGCSTAGDPDYDTDGRYQGCNGVGCLVDPVPQNEDDEIDPRPQFDAQGNPNFDTHGNYIGCHGVGCLVDGR